MDGATATVVADDFSVESTYVAPAPEPAAEPVVAEPALESETETADAVAEPTDAVESDDAGKLTPFRKGAKPRDDAFARMKQATDKLAEEKRLREQAETRARDLEQRLSSVLVPSAPKAAVPSGQAFPAWEQYLETHPGASYDDWDHEKTKHVARQMLTEWQREQQQVAEQQEQQRVLSAHAERMQKSATKYPDMGDMVAQAERALAAAGIARIPPALERAVLSSDRSDDLTYFLGTHPEEVIQLSREAAALGPDAAPVIRRYLESRVSAAPLSTGPASAPRSQATPPIRPVGGTASAMPAAVEDLPFEEYVERMNKLDRERRKL